MTDIPERGGVNAVWGDAVIEVAKRGGNDIVRPRHPDNPLRTAFRGTPTYPPHPRWAVAGRYVPFAEPRPTQVGSVVDGLEHVYDAPGRVQFTLDGQDLALTVFPGHEPGSLSARSPTLHPASRRIPPTVLCCWPLRLGRHGGPGLQPRGQPALRLHRPRDLPAAAGREPAAGRDAGGREDLARTRLTLGATVARPVRAGPDLLSTK